MRIPIFDIRKSKKKFCAIATLRSFVRCTKCKWKGYRMVGFKKDLASQIHCTDAEKYRGEKVTPPCPHCNNPVMFICIVERL